jgi:ribosomal protein S18 acetylase RimI-like enzyme
VAIEAAGKVVGFAVGGEPNIRNLFLRRAVFRYPYIIIWKFLTNPSVRHVLLKELTRKLHFKYRPTTIPENTKTQETTTHRGNLLSICVLPDYKGTGIAGKLIRFFQLACTAEGYNYLMLSVTTDNLRAIAFYKKHGWRETGKSGKSTKFALNLQPSLMEP